ncbi:MAG TPA: hypothetical protein VEG30_11970 [Terriglobales bacterium]|nr:hypothetical protein [Terriglobales bacterium]
MDEISRNSTSESWPPVPGKWIALLVAAVVLAHAIWACLSALTNGLLLPFLSGIAGPDPQVTQFLGKADPGFPAIVSSLFELVVAGLAFLLIRRWTGPRPTPAPAKPARTVKVVKQVRVAKAVSRSASQPLSIIAPPKAAETSAEPQPSVKPDVSPQLSSAPPKTVEPPIASTAQTVAEEPVSPPRQVEQPPAAPSPTTAEMQVRTSEPVEKPVPARLQPVDKPVQVPSEMRGEEPAAVSPQESDTLSATPPAHSAPVSPPTKPKKAKEKEKEVYYNLVGDPIGPVEDE